MTASIGLANDHLRPIVIHAPATRTLRVEAPACVSRHLIAPALPRFLHQRPGLRVQLREVQGAVEPLPREVDAALRTGPVHDSTLIVQPLATIRSHHLCVSRFHCVQRSAGDTRRSGAHTLHRFARTRHDYGAYVDLQQGALKMVNLTRCSCRVRRRRLSRCGGSARRRLCSCAQYRGGQVHNVGPAAIRARLVERRGAHGLDCPRPRSGPER